MTEEIKLSVEATVPELMKGNALAQKSIFAGWRRIISILASLGWGLTVLVMGGLGLFLVVRFLSSSPGELGFVAGIWPLIVALLSLPVMIARVWLLYGSAKRSRFGIRRDFTIDKVGVEAVAPGGVLRVEWSGVQAVRRSRKVIALVYANMFMVLPVRCFPSPQAADDALQQMRRWHQEALK